MAKDTKAAGNKSFDGKIVAGGTAKVEGYQSSYKGKTAIPPFGGKAGKAK